MRLLKPLFAIVATLIVSPAALGATWAYTGPVTAVSGSDPGHVQFPYSEAAVAIRPRAADQKTLLVENYYIHDLANQKGLDLRASIQPTGPAWAYNSITVRNSTFRNIERHEDEPGGAGLHIDHIRIAGGGNNQDTKINILIENVVIDGGDALPILVTDGTYGTVTLRNVIIRNTTLNNVQFKTDKVGSVDKIIVENCPDIGVALIGRPGSVGEVLVRNSPGIRLGDSLNATGRTGATISFIDSAGASDDTGGPVLAPGDGVTPTPAPEPGALGLLALAAATALLRRPTRR
jgi:MYXO-CTERM domain-containing protein